MQQGLCGALSENYDKYIEFIDELYIINPKVLKQGFAYIKERTSLDVKVMLIYFVTKKYENFKYFWCNDSDQYKDYFKEMMTINENVLFCVHSWKKDVFKYPDLVSTIVDKSFFTKNLVKFVDNRDSEFRKIQNCFFPILAFNRCLSLKSNVKLDINALQLIFSYHYLNSLPPKENKKG